MAKLTVPDMGGVFNVVNSHVYHYAGNNPVKYTDPDGQDIKEWIESGINWFVGDSNYNGSGWGHGLRTEIRNGLGLTDQADGLIDTVIMSLLQGTAVNLNGQALEKISSDPAMLSYEANLLSQVKSDSRFGQENFSFQKREAMQFGGKRAAGDMGVQFKNFWDPKYADTWKVAGNELTWLVRSTTVNSQIDVNANGEITMTHSFSDIFDLRPSMERSDAYNNVTKVLGFLYHDVLGGNDQMRVNATWQKSYKLEVE